MHLHNHSVCYEEKKEYHSSLPISDFYEEGYQKKEHSHMNGIGSYSDSANVHKGLKNNFTESNGVSVQEIKRRTAQRIAHTINILSSNNRNENADLHDGSEILYLDCPNKVSEDWCMQSNEDRNNYQTQSSNIKIPSSVLVDSLERFDGNHSTANNVMNLQHDMPTMNGKETKEFRIERARSLSMPGGVNIVSSLEWERRKHMDPSVKNLEVAPGKNNFEENPPSVDKHYSVNPMPHGLTVQELKELTRIRLAREKLGSRWNRSENQDALPRKANYRSFPIPIPSRKQSNQPLDYGHTQESFSLSSNDKSNNILRNRQLISETSNLHQKYHAEGANISRLGCSLPTHVVYCRESPIQKTHFCSSEALSETKYFDEPAAESGAYSTECKPVFRRDIQKEAIHKDFKKSPHVIDTTFTIQPRPRGLSESLNISQSQYDSSFMHSFLPKTLTENNVRTYRNIEAHSGLTNIFEGMKSVKSERCANMEDRSLLFSDLPSGTSVGSNIRSLFAATQFSKDSPQQLSTSLPVDYQHPLSDLTFPTFTPVDTQVKNTAISQRNQNDCRSFELGKGSRRCFSEKDLLQVQILPASFNQQSVGIKQNRDIDLASSSTSVNSFSYYSNDAGYNVNAISTCSSSNSLSSKSTSIFNPHPPPGFLEQQRSQSNITSMPRCDHLRTEDSSNSYKNKLDNNKMDPYRNDFDINAPIDKRYELIDTTFNSTELNQSEVFYDVETSLTQAFSEGLLF